MAKRSKRALSRRSRELKDAMALQPLIDDVQDSLDRFQVLFDEGGDITAAMVDLTLNVEALEEGVDKADEVERKRDA